VAIQYYPPDNYIMILLGQLIYLNVALGIFNLIPVPPLDGSRLLVTLLPPRYDHIAIWLERNGFWLLIFLLILARTTGFNFLGGAVSGTYQLMFGWL
jgi:Zn-dependent protease